MEEKLSKWMVGTGELYYTDGDQERVREEKIGQQRGRESMSVSEKVGSPWDIPGLK